MKPESQKLLDSVLKYLSYRPRSRAEIVKYLQGKTQDSDLINQTVEKLEKIKLINDSEFAAWVIASRSRSRPRGAFALQQELKQKGIDMKVEVDEVGLAEKALQKKLNLWSHLSYRDFYVKASRFLGYRGFKGSIIAAVVKKAYNDQHVKSDL